MFDYRNLWWNMHQSHVGNVRCVIHRQYVGYLYCLGRTRRVRGSDIVADAAYGLD